MSGPAFRSRAVTLRGRLTLLGSPGDLFPLFSPEGERRWVPGWDPELLHPPGTPWVRGQIFRTRKTAGEVVWLVTRLDLAAHHVEYHRVEPGRFVARVEVACRRLDEQRTEVTTSYTYVGLSGSGNAEVEAMTQAGYDEKMARWEEWIEAR